MLSLRSGDNFWLLSPYYRNSSGGVYGFVLYSSGYLSNGYVSVTHGVRPSISLNPGTTAVSGTGTATDPWIVNPPTMQNATQASLAAAMPNNGDTTTLPDALKHWGTVHSAHKKPTNP
ncbi:hypothetical protein IJI91_02740 [Candidatus Saccharibacteria bacterium]|nr:hypothetical protein [Candidatus Saccharibacteria bacterium]